MKQRHGILWAVVAGTVLGGLTAYLIQPVLDLLFR